MVSRPCTVAMKVLQIYGCRRDGKTWHSFMDRVYLHVINITTAACLSMTKNAGLNMTPNVAT